MTTIVGLGRSERYALFSYDNICYRQDGTPGGTPLLTLGARRKVQAVSPFVLVGCGGDTSIGDDFFRRLRQRLLPTILISSHFNAVYAAARDVVDELVADDPELAGSDFEFHDLPGAPLSVRASIREFFTVQLVGFERDSTTRAAQWQYSTNPDWDDGTFPNGELVIGAAIGVDVERDIVPLYSDFYASSGCPTIADAFSFAFAVHRILGRKYPDRLSPDVNVVALRWRDNATPQLLELEPIQHEDIDGFYEHHAALEALTGGGP